MRVHLPYAWGEPRPACGHMAPGDEVLTDPEEAEAVTCPACASMVIGFTLSDRPKVGC